MSDQAGSTSNQNAPDSPPSDQDVASWYYEVNAEAGAEEDEDDPDYRDEPDEDDEEGDAFYDAAEGEDDREDDDEDDEEFHVGGVEFQLFIGDDEEEEEGDELAGGAPEPILRLLRARTGQWSSRQLLTFLRNPDVNTLMEQLEDEAGDDGMPWGRFMRRRRRVPKDPARFPKVPSEEGQKLMASGVFGSNNQDRHKRKLGRRLLERELALGDSYQRKNNNGLLIQDLVPSTQAEHIIHYDDPIYSGQFSDDGNFFFSVCQDFKVRMYDTSNPYNWKHYKTVSYPWGQWTLTDASLSPDNKWLAYSSISSMVSIAPTDPLDQGDPYTLDLSDSDGMERDRWGRRRGFSGIWSVRFSGDGRELVAGTNHDSLVVYDIESRRVLHHIEGHQNDVNAVCFADKGSPHIIYSGSDDATIKVWDRRSMGDKREAGAFVGHIEGLTYIDSKGDGRYILSNGKDQSMKLWDLRMIMSTDRFREIDPTQHTRYSNFDYRSGRWDDDQWDVHPNDNSVVTFRGHQVLNTLIRCHFSPPNSTNSRYVYSGSRDGKVHIWNMDATKAGEIDVRAATHRSRPIDNRSRFFHHDEWGSWATCVRDASWHPNAPFIVASAWNGYNMARGTCTLHSFNEGPDPDTLQYDKPKNYDAVLQPTQWDLSTAGLNIDDI